MRSCGEEMTIAAVDLDQARLGGAGQMKCVCCSQVDAGRKREHSSRLRLDDRRDHGQFRPETCRQIRFELRTEQPEFPARQTILPKVSMERRDNFPTANR